VVVRGRRCARRRADGGAGGCGGGGAAPPGQELGFCYAGWRLAECRWLTRLARAEINDISLEDYIAVKPKYAIYGALRPIRPNPQP